MQIKFVRSIVAFDSQGEMHAISSETIITVQKTIRRVGGQSIVVNGDEIYIVNEPYAILMGPPAPPVEIAW